MPTKTKQTKVVAKKPAKPVPATRVKRTKPTKFVPATRTPLPLAAEPTTVRPVTCADYLRFTETPEAISNCDERIRLIHHAATCAACLDLVFAKLERLSAEPADAGSPA